MVRVAVASLMALPLVPSRGHHSLESQQGWCTSLPGSLGQSMQAGKEPQSKQSQWLSRAMYGSVLCARNCLGHFDDDDDGDGGVGVGGGSSGNSNYWSCPSRAWSQVHAFSHSRPWKEVLWFPFLTEIEGERE